MREVCEPLLLTAPPKRVRELRAELAEHLDSLVAARIELGDDVNTAVEAALRQFGDADQLATQWARQQRGRWSQVSIQELTAFGGMFTITALGSLALLTLEAGLSSFGSVHLLVGPWLPLVVGTVWGRRIQRSEEGSGWLALACISLAVSNLLWEQGRYTPSSYGSFAVIAHLISTLATGAGMAGLVSRFHTRHARKETPPGIRLA